MTPYFESALGTADYNKFIEYVRSYPPQFPDDKNYVLAYFNGYAAAYLTPEQAKAGKSAINEYYSGGPSSPNKKKLSTGAIVGISIGSVVGFILFVLILKKICRKDNGSYDPSIQRGLLDE